MITLQKLRERDPTWSLDEFVGVVNSLLPDYVSRSEGSGRTQEQMNARLVRHYTGLGLIDRPGREGKEARYGYRHLLQLLVLRRLLQEGYTSQAIVGITPSRSNEELEALLQGGARLTVETANPALAFLKQVQARAGPKLKVNFCTMPALATKLPDFASGPTPAAARWTRVDVAPGLELHIRQDYVWPGSPQEQKNLFDLMAQNLSRVAGKRRRSR